MIMHPTCSLQVSTYNWPQALALCLESVMQQSILPDEIVVCDDGSGKETTDCVKYFQQKSKVPVVHVWQEDEGFRLAHVRNRGFASTNKEYVIQIDGDIILHRDYIKDHLRFCRKGFFTTGSRVLLSPDTTAALIQNKSIDVKKFASNDSNFFNGLHIPFLQDFFAQRYKQKGKHRYYVKGCNMAFWRSDILKVNGYNEDFTGWGREDSEIAIRLMNAGVQKRFIKFGGIQYHLYHKEASRSMEEKNIKMMQDAIDKGIARANNGLDKYFVKESVR
jgi:glycosyltransferase involved in cell wall biosynthesis